MNWAKGRATKGRGTSFKGVLVYVLHDKDAQTSERVGFIDLHNLATDDPHRAWREILASLFKLMISPTARRKQFQRQQETQRQALRQRQAQSRNQRAATLKAARRVELAKLSQEFQKNRETMKARHASEVAAQKMVWRQLAAERQMVWSDYRQEFAIKEAGQENASQQQSLRDEFREAASGTTRAEAKPEHEQKADQNQGNGADLTPTTEKSTRRDWRARRSAAERKADGTYKKRDRGNDDGGRSRERDRHEPD
jgi:hypothetical protein